MKNEEVIDNSIEKMELIKRIGEKVQQLRIENTQLTTNAFAKKYSINHQTYYRMEQGENFTILTFIKVLEVHKISLNAFFEGLE